MYKKSDKFADGDLSLLVLLASISGTILCPLFFATYDSIPTFQSIILIAYLLLAITVLLSWLFSGAQRVRRIRWALLSGLVLSIGLSPEVPIGILLAGGRSFTLRVEDLYLVVLLLGWLITSWRFYNIYFPPFIYNTIAYFIIATIITMVSVKVYNLPLLRSLLYLLKEVEFILMGFIVANLIKTENDLRVLLYTVFFTGLLNASWMGFQIITGDVGSLFPTANAAKWRYGPSLIGQPSVLASAGFFIVPIFCSYGLIINRDDWYKHPLFVGLFIMFLVAMFTTLSRSALVATILSMCVLTGLSRPKWMIKLFGVVTISTIAVALSDTLLIRRLRFESVISSLRGRVEIWAGFLNRPWHELVVGYGKGSSTPLFGMEEAHNFYIRLLTEVGVPGLIAFVMIIAVVVRMSLRLYQTGETPIIQSVGFACVGTSITLLIIAGVQDVFINVKVAEMYWMLVGATAAAYRFTVVDK